MRYRFMKGLTLLLLIMLMAGCGTVGTGSNSGATKSASSTVKLTTSQTIPEEASHRIVSTTVAITQIMDALELDLIGIPKSVKTLPERYSSATKVGNPMSPDMEIVKSLKPTEVLSVSTLQYELEPVFESAGLRAGFLNLTSILNMQFEITELGEKYGREAQAAKIVNDQKEMLASITSKTEGKEKPTVLILLGVPGSYLVATEHSYIGDLVRLLGGVNIVQGERVEFLASNTEYLQKANPDVILRAAHGMPAEVVKMFDEEFKKNDIWKHFEAVQTGRVYDLEETLFGTTGNLAVVQALTALAPMLYPDYK